MRKKNNRCKNWLPRTMLPLFALLLSACGATTPLPSPDPIDGESAGLGLYMKIRTPIKIVSRKPDIILFVRLEDGETLHDLLNKKYVIASTVADGGYVYLLNAYPGTWVAVAAIFGWDHTETDEEVPEIVPPPDSEETVYNGYFAKGTYRCYFSRELIEQTMITIDSGTFTFAGRFVCDGSASFGDGDDFQRHFLWVVEGRQRGRSIVESFSSGNMSTRVTPHDVDRSREAENEFRKIAAKHLSGTGWEAMLYESSDR